MSNGDDRWFIFIERGTDPTVVGTDAPLNSLCTYGGVIYVKTGDLPTDWTAAAGGFSGGVVPDATTFQSAVTFDVPIDGPTTVDGDLETTGTLIVTGGGGAAIDGTVGISGNVSAVDAEFSGNIHLGTASGDLIREYTPGAGGVAQAAAIPDAADLATAITAVNALLAYFRSRGTVAT